MWQPKISCPPLKSVNTVELDGTNETWGSHGADYEENLFQEVLPFWAGKI